MGLIADNLKTLTTVDKDEAGEAPATASPVSELTPSAGGKTHLTIVKPVGDSKIPAKEPTIDPPATASEPEQPTQAPEPVVDETPPAAVPPQEIPPLTEELPPLPEPDPNKQPPADVQVSSPEESNGLLIGLGLVGALVGAWFIAKKVL